MKLTLHLARLIALASAVFLSSPLSAGGLEFPDLGTAGIGRGGAFTAKADDPSAFHYNPAGLSKSEKIDLHLSVHLVNLNVDYTRSGGGGYWLGEAGAAYSDTCPTGEICIGDPALDYRDGAPGVPFETVSMNRVGAVPVFVFNWGNFARVKGLALSIGVLPPSSFGGHQYPEGGPQRYVLIDTKHMMLFPGVGLAYRFNRYIQVGAVFLSGFAILEQTLIIRPLPSLASNSFNEGSGGDARLSMDATDPFIPSGIFGVMSNPLDWLELGFTVKLPAMIRAEGTFKYTAPSQDMSRSYMEDGQNNVLLEQSFPLVMRFGARYVHSRFDVEADFVYENWHSMQEFNIFPDAMISDPISDTTVTETPMPDTSIPKNFRDTYSIRLGGDVAVWRDHLDLRIGTFYQSSAYPSNNETFAVDFPYARQIGLGGGLTVHAGPRVEIDFGYLHIFQPTVEVARGIVQQQGLPLSTGEDIGNTMNGGTYDVNLNIFSIAATGHFN